MQHGSSTGSDDGALFALFGAIASGDRTEIARRLDSSLRLASRPIRIAASRQDAGTYFIAAIRHHVYAGDTALHVAAAAYENSPSRSSPKAPMCAPATDGAPNRFTAPPTAVPTQSTGTRLRSVRFSPI